MDGFGLPQAASISFGEFLWSLLIIFFMIVFFVILIQVLIDLFRSKDLSGWAKAGWLLLIVVLPYLGLFIYLIARGKDMAFRQYDAARDQQDAVDAYIRETAGGSANEIAKAKELLDAGTITQEEFDAIKKRALG